MLIAITGLHAAGKSYFVNNVPVKFGFKIYNKKEIVKYICKKETNRDDWSEWYKEEFNKDAYRITKKILSYINVSENVVLDAVHSDLEWNIISNIVPDSELIGMITPDFIREQRREEGDIEKDKKRLKYWHNGGGCLMKELSWSFNGGASLEINEKMFEEFLEYIKRKQLSINGEKVEFSENKTQKLKSLIEKNADMDIKINKAKKLLKEYEQLDSSERVEEIEK